MDPVVVNRYLADRLTDAERLDFESRLVASPAVVEALESAARMKAGLMRLRDAGQLERIVFSPSSWTPRVLAIAASVTALAIGIAVWRGDGARLAAPALAPSVAMLLDDSGRQLDIVGRHAVLRTRAEGYDAIIDRPRAPGALEIRVLPDASASSDALGARYRVELARIDDGPAAPIVVGGLKAQEDGFVTLFASSSQLAAGKYRLTIAREGDGASPAETDSFSIRVR
jgi:hypothetical protein